MVAGLQVLKSWRTRRMLDLELLDQISADLEARRAQCVGDPSFARRGRLGLRRPTRTATVADTRDGGLLRHHSDTTDDKGAFANFTKNDILRRIEDDRERVSAASSLSQPLILSACPPETDPSLLAISQHKRLRERIWVLPVPTTLLPTALVQARATTTATATHTPVGSGPSSTKPSPFSPASPKDMHPPPVPLGRAQASAASRFKVNKRAGGGADSPSAQTVALPAQQVVVGKGAEVALEIEFEQLWEASEEERTRALKDSAQVGEKRSREEEGGWPLGERERRAMRSQRERCFAR